MGRKFTKYPSKVAASNAAKSSKSDILDRYVGKDIWLKVKISQKAYFRRGYINDQYWIRIVDKDEDGNYVINRVSSYREYKGNSTQKQRTLSNTYTVNENSITPFNPIQTAATDEIFNVEACDKVTASTKPHPKIPEGWERVPEGDDDDGNWGSICKELPNDSGYVWIDMYYNEKDRRYYEIQYAYREKSGAVGKIWGISQNPFYSLNQALEYAERRFFSGDDEDIDACGDIKASSKPEYMADMVSCSRDSMLFTSHCKYYVAGYYDGNKQGLASDFDTDDFDAALEGAHEMASLGLTVVITNEETGRQVEYSPDVWMDAIDDGEYPSGVYSIM